MKNPNSLLSLILFLLAAAGVSAQEAASTKVRLPEEIGLRLVSLQDFDFIYKKELGDGSYRRMRLLSANASFNVVRDVTVVGFAAVVAIGREQRVPVAEKLIFHHGWEPGLALGVGSVVGNPGAGFLANVNPFVGYVLGFQLAASERFVLGLEVIPSFSLAYTLRGDGGPNTLQASVGFNTGAVGVTGVYRFTRK